MRILLPLLSLAIVACEPIDETELCESGIREAWTSTIPTPDGSVDVQLNQCVRAGWSWAECAEGNEPHCLRMFAPNQPPQTPVTYVFGDHVFTQAVGQLTMIQPEPFLGPAPDLTAGMTAVRDDRLASGYEVSTVDAIGAFDGHPAVRLRVSCDHPDVSELCPFTWEYLLVDLGSIYPGLYADLSMHHADYISATDATAVYPEEFDHYHGMIENMHLLTE